MGKGLAKNLRKAGHRVFAYKRDPNPGDPAIKELLASGVEITRSQEEVFRTASILATCLPRSEVIEDVLIGPHGLLAATDCSVRFVLEFSTAKPGSTRLIAQKLGTRNIEMLDTPMGGGPQQAEEGALKLVVGGKKQVFEAMSSLLKPLASNIVYAGPSGAGHTLKLVNNFMGILNQCTAAAVCTVVEQMDIPLDTLHDFISVSGGNSWGFQNEMETIKEGAFGLKFALSYALKDLGYAKDLFESAKMEFGVLNSLIETFDTAAKNGWSERDVRAVYLYMKEKQNT